MNATLFLAAGLLAAPGPLEVEARLVVGTDAGVLRVGDPFTLRIEARHAAGRIALLPAELGLPSALGERRQARDHRRELRGEGEADIYTLELLGFEPGKHTIPALRVALGSTTSQTRPLVVEVLSQFEGDELLVATSTLAAAIPELESMAAGDPAPEQILVPDRRPLWLALLAALALGLFALVYRWQRRSREAPPGPAPAPPRPPHELALARLEALRASDRLARDPKDFFTELSSILREYAGARYGFDSLELTVDELMDALRERKAPDLDLATLYEVLTSADLVKFAKFALAQQEAERALEQAFSVVRATQPAPPLPGGEA